MFSVGVAANNFKRCVAVRRTINPDILGAYPDCSTILSLHRLPAHRRSRQFGRYLIVDCHSI